MSDIQSSPNQEQEPSLTKRQRRLLRREEDERAQGRVRRASGAQRWGKMVLVLLVLGGGVWGLSKIPAVRSLGDPLKTCVNHTGTGMHIHPHLKIVINGAERLIPADIGIVRGCMRPLHTHNDSGTIHNESVARRDFTLGQFFEVWGKVFSQDAILDARVDETHEIIVTVNGVRVQTYGDTIMRDKDQIIIEYREKL